MMKMISISQDYKKYCDASKTLSPQSSEHIPYSEKCTFFKGELWCLSVSLTIALGGWAEVLNGSPVPPKRSKICLFMLFA